MCDTLRAAFVIIRHVVPDACRHVRTVFFTGSWPGNLTIVDRRHTWTEHEKRCDTDRGRTIVLYVLVRIRSVERPFRFRTRGRANIIIAELNNIPRTRYPKDLIGTFSLIMGEAARVLRR